MNSRLAPARHVPSESLPHAPARKASKSTRGSGWTCGAEAPPHEVFGSRRAARCDTVSVRVAVGQAGVSRNEPWGNEPPTSNGFRCASGFGRGDEKASCATDGSVDQTIGTGSTGGPMRALEARVLPLQVTAVRIACRLRRCACSVGEARPRRDREGERGGCFQRGSHRGASRLPRLACANGMHAIAADGPLSLTAKVGDSVARVRQAPV